MIRHLLAASLLATPAAAAPAGDGKVLSFSSNLLEPVTPEGGPGKWMSRFDWSRYQSGNNELAPNCDATTDVGATPHLVIDGKRVMRAQLTPSREGARTFAFCAPMMTTYRWRSFTWGFFEVKMKERPEYGVVPAFWLIPASGKPGIEIDGYEDFTGQGWGFRGNVHLTPNGYGGAGYSQDSRLLLNPDGTAHVPDGEWHVYGINRTRYLIEIFIDGKRTYQKAVNNDQPVYLVLNTAVGLHSDGPRWAKLGWHHDVTYDYVKVWQRPEDITVGWVTK